MSLISERYAKAFYELAHEKQKTDAYLEDLVFIRDVWESNPDLQGYINNPRKGPSDKEKALGGIFLDQIETDSYHLILLLLRKGRIALIPLITDDYKNLKDANDGVLEIHVTTAEAADDLVLKKISDKFVAMYGAKSANIIAHVDPSIIGGVIVQIDDTCYDNSVTGKLKALQEELISK